jgi:hypothetical protein
MGKLLREHALGVMLWLVAIGVCVALISDAFSR